MAAKKFPGITIEIGVDTSKLDKALRETNKEISDTQKSLKDVERLLKLDPKNVILLEQKQNLLAKAAENAAKKQDMLQQAVDKSDEALSRNTAYEEKYEPLKKSLEDVSERLSTLKEKKKEVDADFYAHKIPHQEWISFLEEIQNVESEYNSLKAAVVSLNNEFKGNKINQEEYDALHRALINAADAADEAEKSFKNFNPTLEKVGSTAQEVSDKAGKVADAFAPISKAAGGVLTAMFATVPATDDLRTNLARLETNAQQAGIGLEATSDALTQFNRVSGDTDASVEALSNLLMAGATESNLQRAVENLAGAATAFPDTLKIESLADSLQETIATGEATGQFAELLDRLSVSTEIFNAQIGQTQDQSVRLNMAMDVLANEGMADYYNAWITGNEELTKNKDATLELQTSLAELATALTPIVTMVTGFATKLLDWFNDIGPGGQAAIITILGLVAAISPIASMISNIGGAVWTLTKLAGVFTGGVGNSVYLTFAKWALIIMAVVAAVALLIAMINVLIGKGGETNQVLGKLGGGGKSGGGTSVPAVSGVPGFADGGVFMPNHPVVGVLGDNRNEVEIAAPRSAMQEAFLDALDQRGGAEPVNVNIRFTGSLAQLGRVLQPVVTTETMRRGTSVT